MKQLDFGIFIQYRVCHDIQHNDTQHNSKLNTTNSIKTLNIMRLCCYAECHLCYVSIMLSVNGKEATVNKALDGSIYPG